MNTSYCKGCKNTLPIDNFKEKSPGVPLQNCKVCNAEKLLKKKQLKLSKDSGDTTNEEDEGRNSSDSNNTKTRRKEISPTQRDIIFADQSNCCRGPGPGECTDEHGQDLHTCGLKERGGDGRLWSDTIQTIDNKRHFEWDHIKEKKAGGDESIKNMQALCLDCHKRKSNTSQLYDAEMKKPNNECKSVRDMKIILDSLSKPKE